MKNLYVNVSRETRMVNLPKQFIAVDGENLQSKLTFTFIDEFVDGQARLEFEIKGNKNYVVLDKENDTYTIPIKNVITKEGQIDMQLVITEGTNEEEIPVFKSNKFYLFCNSSINAVDEAPEGYDSWLEQANVKLNQIDNLDIDIEENTIIVTKKDGSTESVNVGGGSGGGTGGTSDYRQLSNKPTINNIKLNGDLTAKDLGLQPEGDYASSDDIPKNVSELNNDAGYLTEHQDLKDYALKTEIPDTSSFITKEVSDLSNYYNKNSIDEMIGNIETLLGGI